MLRLVRPALMECGKRGIRRVLMVCDRDNRASARTIEKNGGVFAEKVFDPEYETDVERYRIALK